MERYDKQTERERRNACRKITKIAYSAVEMLVISAPRK
jgi:2-oxo-4-hydroxy-4-carboxy--5-ureidoimidazoline (OHCU) decarboxylase